RFGPGRPLVQPHQLFGMRQPEWPQHHAAEHAEDSRASADTDGKDEHRRRGETGCAAERAKGESQLVHRVKGAGKPRATQDPEISGFAPAAVRFRDSPSRSRTPSPWPAVCEARNPSHWRGRESGAPDEALFRWFDSISMRPSAVAEWGCGPSFARGSAFQTFPCGWEPRDTPGTGATDGPQPT